MRTRTAAALLALTASLALTGCSDSGSDAKAASKPSSRPSNDPGDTFVNSVVDAHLDSYAAGVPAADELKALPPRWCDALDGGHSVAWMFDTQDDLYPIGQTWGTEKSDAYEVLVLGVKAYCPKHTDAVLEELRATGEY